MRPFQPARTTALIEASRPKCRIILGYVAKSKSTVGAKVKLGPSAPRKTMNWFHPVIWVQIEAACRTVGWPFSPTDIKRYLTRMNPDQFGGLHPQRISEWIDKSKGSSLHFTQYVQSRIGSSQALEPGGHTTRIGILVSRTSTHVSILPDSVPRKNTPPQPHQSSNS